MRSTLPLYVAAFAASVPAIAAETVPVAAFRSIELRGGGNIVVVPGPVQRVTLLEGSTRFTRLGVDSDGKLRIDVCREDCPRAYRLRMQIQSPSVPGLAIDGGGSITTAGGFAPQARLVAAVNGGGRVDARQVQAERVSAAVNGGGEVLVNARTSLAAVVNGGGHVRYWGQPSIDMAVHGGGVVTAGN